MAVFLNEQVLSAYIKLLTVTEMLLAYTLWTVNMITKKKHKNKTDVGSRLILTPVFSLAKRQDFTIHIHNSGSHKDV